MKLDAEISSVEPTALFTGDLIKITGTDLNNAADIKVKIGEVDLIPVSSSETELVARIPKEATTGEISIYNETETKTFGNIKIIEERDALYGLIQTGNCAGAKIVKLASDTLEEESLLLSLDENCISVNNILIDKNVNRIAVSYSFLNDKGQEARKAIFADEGNVIEEMILADGSNGQKSLYIAYLEDENIFYLERRTTGFWFKKKGIHRSYPIDEIVYIFFDSDNPTVYSSFSEISTYEPDNILLYVTNSTTGESLYVRGSFTTNSTIQNVVGMHAVDSNTYVVQDNKDDTFSILNVNPYNGALRLNLHTFSASAVSDISFSKSTSRLFMRITDPSDNQQYVYKFPIGDGEPSKIKLDSSVQKIFLDY